MLTEKRAIGESLMFNHKIRTCVSGIQDNRWVTFETILENGEKEICKGLPGSTVTLAGKIKVRIADITNQVVSLEIVSPVDMVITRLDAQRKAWQRERCFFASQPLSEAHTRL